MEAQTPDKRTRRTEKSIRLVSISIGGIRGPNNLGGQLCSALGAAAGQNLAAVLGGHSLSETMHLGSVTLLGMIGTQHCVHLL